MPVPTIADLERGKENLDAFDEIINEDENTTVETPGGQDVDSVAKAIASIKAFNFRGDWAQSTAYAVKDLVIDPADANEAVYVRVTAGTSPGSGTFQNEYDSGDGPWRAYNGTLFAEQAGETGVVDRRWPRGNVMRYGATGLGVANDAAAIAAAVASWPDGGEVYFEPGVYRLTTPLVMEPGITYKGPGLNGLYTTKPGAKIISAVSDLFENAATDIVDVKFDGLWLESEVGGGHIFDWSAAGLVSGVEVVNCVIRQLNAAKSVVNGTSVGGVFSIHMHEFEYQYAASSTVPALQFKAFTVNSVVIENFWSTGHDSAAGTYSINLETTNASGLAINCNVRQGVFEVPGGGAVRMLSCVNSGVEQCATYDLSITPNNPMFVVAKGASGQPSNNCWFDGVRSDTGTAAKPDLQIDCSVSGQSGFLVKSCTLTWLDGVGTGNGPGVAIQGGAITNKENISWTEFGGAATNDLKFGTAAGPSAEYKIWNGYASNFDGYLNFYKDGAYVGAFSDAGLFEWGGSQTAPAFYINQSGVVNTRNKIYPGTPAAADQAVAGVYGGNGAPVDANGADGDFYFRGDGTKAGNTVIYHREGGVWIALVTA